MRKFQMAAAAATLVLILPFVGTAENNSETYRQLNLFGDVFEKVRADYVEEVSDKELIEAAINGMLTSLDPHSSYLNADNFDDMRSQTKGEFGGLGIEVTMEEGLVKVVSPIDDTPASRAGLQPGDLITHLDGEAVMGLSLADAVDRMRGPVDSAITLTIRRGEEEPFEVSITRAIITVQSVRSRLEGDIGYIRITNFNEQTDIGLEEAVRTLEEESGGKLDGVVLDLRNNPGGLLDQAVAVSDAFLNKGEIVSTRGRTADEAQRFNSEDGDLINGLPLVVLINGGSASASEIVAGALQDHGRAIILGMESFGKGSVQTIIPVPGHGAIRLTTARYYTPSGRSIQAKGIKPDIVVAQARIEPIEQGMIRHEADLRGALENENAPTTEPDAAATPPEDSGAEGADGEAAGPQDYQLARALDLLRGLALITAKSSVN
ncbi:S41 family peptidase [Rhodospirillaceae bacterium SYSU D60014]|uniref:S41 family peptidase n=1 Tax=Virgifigura deserti TaxID=2268457 RepID=UPI000E65F7A1